ALAKSYSVHGRLLGNAKNWRFEKLEGTENMYGKLHNGLMQKLWQTNVAGLCGGSDGGIVGVVGYGGVGQKSRERRAQGMAGILEVNSVFLNRGGRQGIGPQVLYF
nr:hypothetical protein [Tanacetum cinerariifolium]